MVTLVLLLLSLLFLVLAALNVVFSPRINPLGVGLALYVLAELVPMLHT